jgi:putative ABC transport system permease protein
MRRLLLRNLGYYWRTNAAVVAGVATAVAVLAGALLVGQSVRASLRDLLTERIGATGYVVSADRFFREDLADRIPATATAGERRSNVPIVAVKGVLSREGAARQAYDVSVYGVDDRFWQFHGISTPPGFEDRASVVGAPLAAQLGVHVGDTLLLRIGNEQDVPVESLFGRREATSRTIRLTCGNVAGRDRLGEFALRPGQGTVFAIFVPLQRLQRDLGLSGRANTVLLADAHAGGDLQQLKGVLRARVTPEDVGINVHPLADGTAVSVESARVLLDDGVAEAATRVASGSGRTATGIFAYLANTIRARGRDIPYSVVAAANLGEGALHDVRVLSGSPMTPGSAEASHSIWLNEWAAKDLGAAIGDPVDIEYYLWQEAGGLVTRTARFTLAGVVAIGGDVNETLVPDVPGVTGARTLRSWDPPFPLDLGRIRRVDEDYWDRYHGTPKAFIALAAGQALWQGRFGRLTAVRVPVPPSEFWPPFARAFDPQSAGFTVAAVRRDGLDASRGAVDLGEYFLYFSFFLIVAAVLLAASFFKLGIEQRVREIGTLRAVGFAAARVRRLFLAEGLVLLALGGALGALGALAYGGVLVAGLRTWWLGAVGTDRVALHVSWGALGIGVAAGAASALAAIVWTLRGLARQSPRALLGGVLESGAIRTRRARILVAVVVAAFVLAGLVLAASVANMVPAVEGFFGAGTLLLVATVTLAAAALRRARPRPIAGRGWSALARLAFRGAAHRPARSLLPVVLIASAAFIIVSVDAFRKDALGDPADRHSGTGGYALVAESVLPVVSDPATAAGREALGLGAGEAPDLADATVVAFRERPGDDASCLNLYAPREPRILAAPRAFSDEGRFSFAASLAASADERRNPWRLLDKAIGGGVVPAVADANSLEYSLHVSVGQEIVVRGSSGLPVRLRIVGALSDTILQGAVIVSEASFLRSFPAEQGFRFFLADVPGARAQTMTTALTERLADAGMRVESTRDRLAGFHRVENTYLSTFQSLGLLGLVLGTVGLLAVLLRNVLERRAELALLRAVGYRERVLAAMVVGEHVLLLAVGLACGTVSALVAITPALLSRGGSVPITMVGALLLTVSAVGVVASLLGGLVVIRAPLVPALRSE